MHNVPENDTELVPTPQDIADLACPTEGVWRPVLSSVSKARRICDNVSVYLSPGIQSRYGIARFVDAGRSTTSSYDALCYRKGTTSLKLSILRCCIGFRTG